MSHPIHCISDVLITHFAMLAAGAASLLLEGASGPVAADEIEMRIVLLPLMGATFVSGALIMLNPQPETRRIVIGRAILALFFGVVVPQLLGAINPWFLQFAKKPMPLLFAGGLIAGITYIMSKPFTRELYRRAEGKAKELVDKLEEKTKL